MVALVAASKFPVKFYQYLTKVTVRKCSSKQMFLKILEYSQENTCIGVKVAGPKTCNFIEKETPTEVFSYEY